MLEDLSTAWLKRRITRLEGMPGLNNAVGSVQMEADILACKHPVFPPCSGGDETTGLTLIGQKHLAQVTDWVNIRWTAYQVERECTAGPWSLQSRTAVHPGEPLIAVELTIANQSAAKQNLDTGFLLSGRSRNTGAEG